MHNTVCAPVRDGAHMLRCLGKGTTDPTTQQMVLPAVQGGLLQVLQSLADSDLTPFYKLWLHSIGAQITLRAAMVRVKPTVTCCTLKHRAI